VRLALLAIAGLLFAQQAGAAPASPQTLLLWPEGAPGVMANGGEETVRITEQGEHVVSNVHNPALTIYLPTVKTAKNAAARTAVIVVPGGGHRELWTDHEGHNVARFLAARGIAAFVLKYRLARAPGSTYTIEGDAHGDLQRAIRLVRGHATEWSLDAKKIGVMGFSAGGQLAALSATRFRAAEPGSRPDFAALIYPGTYANLEFAADTPPMYLLCGGDDRPEVIQGVTRIYLALRELKVPAELHLYDGVPHGFGLRASNTGPIAHWPQQFVDWLGVRGFGAAVH
jgi:acetyl esterase/lipase